MGRYKDILVAMLFGFMATLLAFSFTMLLYGASVDSVSLHEFIEQRLFEFVAMFAVLSVAMFVGRNEIIHAIFEVAEAIIWSIKVIVFVVLLFTWPFLLAWLMALIILYASKHFLWFLIACAILFTLALIQDKYPKIRES